jgi:lipopolysaccharide/colanic/teichoic acid biosynthesis glycosyltransferase
VVSLPVLAAAAITIKLNDRGPVLFRQERVGRDGQRFTCLKLRTMAVDAEDRLADLQEQNERNGPLFKLERDPRVTRVGNMLRATGIDELPQLVNVIRGDMSVVGPRPALPSEAETFDLELQQRQVVRPGLTGLWQISGRSDLPWEEAVRLDLRYVENWSLATDLLIIGKTARAVLSRSGAY